MQRSSYINPKQMKNKYSNHSLNQNSKKKFITEWDKKEGVFKVPNGKWICRVKEVIEGTTLPKWTTKSQHETEEEANKAYESYKK